MTVTIFANATLVLPDRLVPDGVVRVQHGRITSLGSGTREGTTGIDLGGQYLAPGFVDLHVHGGDGADFMDGTAEAKIRKRSRASSSIQRIRILSTWQCWAISLDQTRSVVSTKLRTAVRPGPT